MSALLLQGETTQHFPLPYAPAIAFRYFARNEALLAQLLGAHRVSRLPNGDYRVVLNAHGAFGLSLRPSFDVRFTEVPPDRVEMHSVAVRLLESSHDDTAFHADFTGEATFAPDGPGTAVTCRAAMHVELVPPRFLAWMPPAVVTPVINGVIHAAMDALGGRLAPLMQRDIRRWVAENPRAASGAIAPD